MSLTGQYLISGLEDITSCVPGDRQMWQAKASGVRKPSSGIQSIFKLQALELPVQHLFTIGRSLKSMDDVAKVGHFLITPLCALADLGVRMKGLRWRNGGRRGRYWWDRHHEARRGGSWGWVKWDLQAAAACLRWCLEARWVHRWFIFTFKCGCVAFLSVVWGNRSRKEFVDASFVLPEALRTTWRQVPVARRLLLFSLHLSELHSHGRACILPD